MLSRSVWPYPGKARFEFASIDETWGRYTFLGYDPKMDITCVDGHMRIGSVSMNTENPSEVLRQILSDYRSPQGDFSAL